MRLGVSIANQSTYPLYMHARMFCAVKFTSSLRTCTARQAITGPVMKNSNPELQLRSVKSDPTCKPGTFSFHGPWRPGSWTNAAGPTHIHIQWCNRNWCRAPALHFGSDFSERNCTTLMSNVKKRLVWLQPYNTHFSNHLWWMRNRCKQERWKLETRCTCTGW